MRYVTVGGNARTFGIAISTKFLAADSDAIHNAARKIPPPIYNFK